MGNKHPQTPPETPPAIINPIEPLIIREESLILPRLELVQEQHESILSHLKILEGMIEKEQTLCKNPPPVIPITAGSTDYTKNPSPIPIPRLANTNQLINPPQLDPIEERVPMNINHDTPINHGNNIIFPENRSVHRSLPAIEHNSNSQLDTIEHFNYNNFNWLFIILIIILAYMICKK